MPFLIIIVAFILIRLGEFVSLFARISYFKKSATDKKREKALRLYRFAVKLGGCSRMTKINYAYLALRHGKIDEAEEILVKELRTASKPAVNTAIKSTLALVYWKKGDIDNAINFLEEVVSRGANATAYGSLGHMYNLKADINKALEFNKMAIEYAPDDNIIMDNYGTSLYRSGDIKGAKKVYKQLVEKNPTFPEAYVTYARILKDEGNKGGAEKMLKKALGTNFTFLTTLTKEEISKMIDDLK